MDAFLYHLYGMYLVVLAKRMAACYDERHDSGCALFPRALQPGEHGRNPGADLCGPLPRVPLAPSLRMRPGMPSRWPGWELAFTHDLVR